MTISMQTGLGIAWLLNAFIPALPVNIEWNYILLVELFNILTGMIAGLLPTVM